MSEYRRFFITGGDYFFTLVTERRRPILTSELSLNSLRHAIAIVRKSMPFEIPAMVLLPDHLHMIWRLPQGDMNYSDRIRKIKTKFTQLYVAGRGVESGISESKRKKGEKGVWQRRFWEHSIRDSVDFENHYHYIHYNPVKHRYVTCVGDWPYSTFHQEVNKGLYPRTWGCITYGKPMEVPDFDLN
ncbi:MAG: REP-associated tyrosine transposase [bacterium]